MMAYIVRRLFYAIPILIGVNLLTGGDLEKPCQRAFI